MTKNHIIIQSYFAFGKQVDFIFIFVRCARALTFFGDDSIHELHGLFVFHGFDLFQVHSHDSVLVKK